MEQPDYGSLTEYFDLNGQSVYFSIHPEMYPAETGIAPTGRYLIYCIHPVHGSCHFIVEQDKDYVWQSEHYPHLLTRKL